MCGIVGAVTKRPIAKFLIDGLKKLEYRGYDSAGLAVLDDQQNLDRLRVVGKVKALDEALKLKPLQGHIGIAHTRWATHGAPSEANAHPFFSHDEFALVHNGIIENHTALREKLLLDNYSFFSETDTEVIVHLIHYYFKKNKNLIDAIRSAVQELKGAYALGVISKSEPYRLIAVRQGSPLVIGKGQGEHFIASDPLALLSVTQQFIYLEDDDFADITLNDLIIYGKDGTRVNREQHQLTITQDSYERGEYRHYMKKEIMEQPKAIHACLAGHIFNHRVPAGLFGHQAENIFSRVEHIQLVACGTSYHAAMVAQYWFQSLLNMPCSVAIASEFRYGSPAHPKNSLFVTLSQSGETADTLAALRLAKKMGYLSTLAICNVGGSSIIREADLHFLTLAGIEIGVASTKAFVTQLTALLLLTTCLLPKTSSLQNEIINDLQTLPKWTEAILKEDQHIARWAALFTHKQHALFLGRKAMYPIALEGALKMKELSYIHAEGYPSGELKHGPLALVDPNMPVIALAPNDNLFEKNVSNLQEVRARGGMLFVITDKQESFHQQSTFVDTHIFTMPSVSAYLAPILYTIPLQLLAYHVAVLKGTDVDQPRNLAKSVTVE